MFNVKSKYYVVDSIVLPEVFQSVMEVKKLLQEGKRSTVNDAVKEIGISRSTYYKYKDSIFDFYNQKTNIITLILMLEHVSGTLSRTLEVIAKSNANVLTINQNIPQNDAAMVSISIETTAMNQEPGELIQRIKSLPGIKKLETITTF